MAKGTPKRTPKKNKGFKPKSDRIPRKAQDPISHDSMNFSWRVNNNYIDYDHPEFGWNKVELIYFLKKIIQALQSFEGMIWYDVKQKGHCHSWGLDEIPVECFNRLEERQIDIVELYQIPLGNKQRIIGYKTGKFFYLMWYDHNHKFCPMKAK